jgi:hypothetical protein
VPSVRCSTRDFDLKQHVEWFVVGDAGLRRALVAIALPGALLGLLLIPSASASSKATVGATTTLTGKLLGLPVEKGISVSVEAVSLSDGTVAASEVAPGASYSLRVPAGPYLVVGSALDPAHGRARSAYRAVQAPAASGGPDLALTMRKLSSSASDATSGSTTTSVAIGNITITGPDGFIPGVAQGGLISGLLPVCQAAGSKVIDHSTTVENAIAQEQKLAQQGQLAVRFEFNPITPDFEISGAITVGPGGGPLADLTVTDTKTGKVVQHIKAGGDPADWEDISHWEAIIGAGAGKKLTNSSDCGKPSKQVPPTTTPAATTTTMTAGAQGGSCDPGKGGICVVLTGQIKAEKKSPHTFATDYQATVGWRLEWQTSISGYGVPNEFVAKASEAFGHGEITYQGGPKPCKTGFKLLDTNPPTLAQGGDFNSKTELTIEIPNPADDSTGGGAGYPAIAPTNPQCPALLSALPGNFQIKVQLSPGQTHEDLKDKDGGTYETDYAVPSQDITGGATMIGTITVVVG